MLEKTEGRKRIGRQRMRWLDSITDLDSMGMRLSKLPETLEKRGVMGSQRVGQDLVTEQQQILRIEFSKGNKDLDIRKNKCVSS